MEEGECSVAGEGGARARACPPPQPPVGIMCVCARVCVGLGWKGGGMRYAEEVMHGARAGA